MRKLKMSDVGEFLGAVPAALWQKFVQMPRTRRRMKHAGRGADCQQVRLHHVSLAGVCLAGANLSQASLLKVDLRGADLSNANLSYARLSDTNMQGVNLRGAIMHGALLTGIDLQNADLTGADLTRAMLRNPKCYFPAERLRELTPERQRDLGFVSPNLAGVDLTGAILVGADLLDADLTGAKLTGVRADIRTRWPEEFDPKQHGIQIPPLAPEWQLKRGEVVLGTLRNCCPDYRTLTPWLRGHFAAAAAFEAIRPHFEETARRLRAKQYREYEEAYEPIRALALRLVSSVGEIIELSFLHIEGEEARFNY